MRYLLTHGERLPHAAFIVVDLVHRYARSVGQPLHVSSVFDVITVTPVDFDDPEIVDAVRLMASQMEARAVIHLSAAWIDEALE